MKALAAALLCLTLAACGLRLRGTAEVPFEKLYVPHPTSGLALELKRNLQSGTRARVVDDPK